MKTKILLFLSLFLFVGDCWGQITFQKTYGETFLGQNLTVQQTGDSGYIIGSSIASCDECPFYFLLVKTDKYGDTLWTKKYGNAGDMDMLSSVQQTFDGGYIIVGEIYYPPDSSQICLIKTNSLGDTSWTKDFLGAVPSMAQQTKDSGYIIVGTAYGDGVAISVGLIKTDANGNIMWSNSYGGGNGDEGYTVQQTKDGGYIVFANTNSFGVNDAIYIIKTDAGGNVVWSKTFLQDALGPNNVLQTYDGGYIILTYDGTTILTKLDSSGKILWIKDYLIGVSHSNAIQQTTDSGFIIAGAFIDSASHEHICLVKTNANGDTVWNKTFYFPNLSEFPYSVQQTYDGGYILSSVVGIEQSFYPLSFYIIKTDANGNDGCNNARLTFTVQSYTDTDVNPSTMQSSQYLTPDTNSIYISNAPVNITSICFSTGMNETKKADAITLFPNPATDQLVITGSWQESKAMKLSIYNMLGERIYTEEINTRQETISCKPFSAGIYFVQVANESGSWVGKFVKE